MPDNGNEWRKFGVVPRSRPLRPCFILSLLSLETEGLLAFQGRAGITSIVRWNLRPVKFGVDFLFGDFGSCGSRGCHKLRSKP